jgi:hypothetical protein
MFENRDLEGSTHFFFDAGNGNLVAYFDLPGIERDSFREVVGGHHHLSISMTQKTGLAPKLVSLPQKLPTNWPAELRCTSPVPTASAWNSLPIRSAKCTGPSFSKRSSMIGAWSEKLCTLMRCATNSTFFTGPVKKCPQWRKSQLDRSFNWQNTAKQPAEISTDKRQKLGLTSRYLSTARKTQPAD